MREAIPAPLNETELEILRRIPTPALSNAVERFNIRPRHTGFTSPSVRAMFPALGPIAGYVATARIRALPPAYKETLPSRREYYQHILSIPQPRIIVVEDLDEPSGVGAWFGEVHANVHRALGCVAAVTNGAVRDLDEVEALGWPMFAASPCVSHANVRLIDFGGSVTIAGLTIYPGDLLVADKHGVIEIPLEIARQIPEAVAAVEKRERQIINFCKSPDFTPEGLAKFWETQPSEAS